MSGLGYLAALLIIAYALLGAYVFFSQPRLVYYPNMPTREVVLTPRHMNMEYQPVTLETVDGERLDGWYVPAPEARATLLFLHGNAGNISHRLDSIRLFRELGLSVFIFDYRGYGRSSGEPGEEGTYRDAEAAWRYLTETRRIDPARIVIFGRSLGGAIAAHLARRYTPRALIIESAFSSVPDFGAEYYPWLPVRWLARFRYDTRSYVSQARSPVLVVHSRDDEIIPFRHGERIFASAPDPKQFLPIRGGHNDGFLVSGPAYVEGLRAFLDVYVPAAAKARLEPGERE